MMLGQSTSLTWIPTARFSTVTSSNCGTEASHSSSTSMKPSSTSRSIVVSAGNIRSVNRILRDWRYFLSARNSFSSILSRWMPTCIVWWLSGYTQTPGNVRISCYSINPSHLMNNTFYFFWFYRNNDIFLFTGRISGLSNEVSTDSFLLLHGVGADRRFAHRRN